MVYQGIRPSEAAVLATLPDPQAREKREKEIKDDEEKREKARAKAGEKGGDEEPAKYATGIPITPEEITQAVRSAYGEGGIMAAINMIDSGMTKEEIEAVGKGEGDIGMGDLGFAFVAKPASPSKTTSSSTASSHGSHSQQHAQHSKPTAKS